MFPIPQWLAADDLKQIFFPTKNVSSFRILNYNLVCLIYRNSMKVEQVNCERLKVLFENYWDSAYMIKLRKRIVHRSIYLYSMIYTLGI